MSPLEKVVLGSLSYKTPFDYQMITFEEIIKNDFLKREDVRILSSHFLSSTHKVKF